MRVKTLEEPIIDRVRNWNIEKEKQKRHGANLNSNKLFPRLFTFGNWTYKWRMGRIQATCQCRVYAFGPFGIVLMGDACFKDFLYQSGKILKFRKRKRKRRGW